MDKIKKIGIASFTFIYIFAVMLSPIINIGAVDFSDEKYWSGVCNNQDSYKENKSECDAFKKYLNDQKAKADLELEDIKKNVNQLSGNIAKDEAILKTIDSKIDSLNLQIETSKNEIASLEVKIVAIEKEIDKLEISIQEKHEIASKYMLNIQSTTRINMFVDFLLGGEDFAEMSRRVEGMNRINEKNQENIRLLNEEKVLVVDKKDELNFERKYKDELLQSQVTAVKEQEELKVVAQERVRVLRTAYLEMAEKRNAAEQASKVLGSKISNIGSIASSQGSMVRPINSGFYVSASVWSYSSGNKHLGIDLAAPRGTAIVAPANGMVIATHTGCPTEGSLSSGCGGGFGNHVVMIVSSENKAYGALYGHMQNGGVLVSPGQKISQGQVIGRVGNSGTSTGAHVHAELFYLGNMSVNEAYDDWWSGSRNNRFGTGGSTWGNEYSHRCDVKGYVPNCRMNPSSYWGLYVGNSG